MGKIFVAFLGVGVWVYFDVYGKVCLHTAAFLVSCGFSIENIVIEGCERVDSTEVQKRLLEKPSRNSIFSVNIETLRKDLESHPWVRSALVRRKLPSTLYIRVAERVPIALWQNQGSLYLIDAEGTLLGTAFIENFAHLPTVVGEEAPRTTASLLGKLDQFPQLRQRLLSATFVGQRRWDLRLSERILVRLPQGAEKSALHFLDTLQTRHGILARPLRVIDLRFPEKFIVRSEKSLHAKNLRDGENKIARIVSKM